MRSGIFIGKTKEDAIQEGLKALKVQLNRVQIEIIDEEKKGLFFGLGSKEARIKMSVKVDPVADASEFLTQVFDALGYEFSMEQTETEDGIRFNIEGEELGVIIGRRGQTLDSLQYLVNIVSNRYSEQPVRFILDAENFRERRRRTLEHLSSRIASQVSKTRKAVSLEPMNSLERKIIHSFLQDHPKVKTTSVGEDPNRYIVISPK